MSAQGKTKKFIILTVNYDQDPYHNPQYGHFEDTIPPEIQGKVGEEEYKHLIAQVDAVWYPIERDAGPSCLACCCCCLSCMTCGLFCICYCCYLCISNKASKNKKIEARHEIKDILDGFNNTQQELKFSVSPIIDDMYVKIALQGQNDENDEGEAPKKAGGAEKKAEEKDDKKNGEERDEEEKDTEKPSGNVPLDGLD